MNLDQAEVYRRIKRFEGEYSDGCTFAPELGTPCCEMHDFLRRDLPDDPENPGHPITPLNADNLLFVCIIKKGTRAGIKAPLYFLLAPFYWLIPVIYRKIGVYR